MASHPQNRRLSFRGPGKKLGIEIGCNVSVECCQNKLVILKD